MPVTLTDSQKVVGTFVPVDAKGNATAPGGPLSVSVGDATVLSASVIDATTFSISAVGPLGANIAVSVTDGVATAQDSVTVVGGAEVSASISFGAPTAQ